MPHSETSLFSLDQHCPGVRVCVRADTKFSPSSFAGGSVMAPAAACLLLKARDWGCFVDALRVTPNSQNSTQEDEGGMKI